MPFRGLITAFEPFRGREQNHSLRVMQAWRDKVADPGAWQAQALPVSLPGMPAQVASMLSDAPDVWLALGECDGPGAARMETIARNRWDLGEDKVSADGGALAGVFSPEGPTERRAHWPAHGLLSAMQARGHTVELSADAGSHCCNALLWSGTEFTETQAVRPWLGFLHLPRESTQLDPHVALLDDVVAWLEAQREGSVAPSVAL